MPKIEVNTTVTKQEANEMLGFAAKELYYLIIGEGENKLVINVGLKTHEAVKKLVTKK